MANRVNNSMSGSQIDTKAGRDIKALHHSGRTFAATVKRLFRIPLAVFGLAVITMVVLMAVFANWIAPYDPEAIDIMHMLEGPTWVHLLGTDQMGRDTLSRIIFGSRVALIVSLGSVSLGVLIGVPLGLISAFFRGWLDEIIMRFMDALVSFPSLILAVGLIAVMGSTLTNVIIAIGVANVPWMARVVRSQALSVREQDYVNSARAIGLGNPRIIIKYIWPNSAAPVIVQSTLGMAYAVLTEAALGFIGIGVQPPTPTWGNMLRYAFALLDRSPILSITPGIAIFLLILAFNFIGDALRDVLDPRLKGVIS